MHDDPVLVFLPQVFVILLLGEELRMKVLKGGLEVLTDDFLNLAWQVLLYVVICRNQGPIGVLSRVLEGPQLVIVGFLLILVSGQIKFILFHAPSKDSERINFFRMLL